MGHVALQTRNVPFVEDWRCLTQVWGVQRRGGWGQDTRGAESRALGLGVLYVK